MVRTLINQPTLCFKLLLSWAKSKSKSINPYILFWCRPKNRIWINWFGFLLCSGKQYFKTLGSTRALQPFRCLDCNDLMTDLAIVVGDRFSYRLLKPFLWPKVYFILTQNFYPDKRWINHPNNYPYIPNNQSSRHNRIIRLGSLGTAPLVLRHIVLFLSLSWFMIFSGFQENVTYYATLTTSCMSW